MCMYVYLWVYVRACEWVCALCEYACGCEPLGGMSVHDRANVCECACECMSMHTHVYVFLGVFGYLFYL